MILVTGATGLVGGHLLIELLTTSTNLSITAIFRTEAAKKRTWGLFNSCFDADKAQKYWNAILWIKADILDIVSIESVFKKSITHVYHCAAMVSFDTKAKELLRETNIEGTANVVNLCLDYKIEKLCYVSSIASLDAPLPGSPINEKSFWNPEIPHSEYARSKYGAEMEVWRASQEGLKVVIVNPGVILGDGFWNTGSSKIFEQIRKGIPFYTTGGSGFVGVWDCVTIMRKLMESAIHTQRFIVVSENISYLKIITGFATPLGFKIPKKEIPKWILQPTGILLEIISWGTGKENPFSKDTIQSLYTQTHYENTKIKKALSFEFTPMTKVLEKVSTKYREYLEKN